MLERRRDKLIQDAVAKSITLRLKLQKYGLCKVRRPVTHKGSGKCVEPGRILLYRQKGSYLFIFDEYDIPANAKDVQVIIPHGSNTGLSVTSNTSER
jgi:hypothetical protein